MGYGLAFAADETAYGFERAYGDVYTPGARAALDVLAPLNEPRRALMSARMQRRAARARDRQPIAFLDPASTIAGTDIEVRDAREGRFQGGVIPADLQRQWIQGTGPATKPHAPVPQGASIVLYLPKIQTAEEAALWNRILAALEEHLSLPVGTIKDMATGENCLRILWEWLHKAARLSEADAATGTAADTPFGAALFERLREEEYAKLLAAGNRDVHDDSKPTTLPIAREIVRTYVTAPFKAPLVPGPPQHQPRQPRPRRGAAAHRPVHGGLRPGRHPHHEEPRLRRAGVRGTVGANP
jgi:hypothetical protein